MVKTMKWILGIVGGLLGLGLLVYGIGALLPRAHVASRTLVLHAPPQAVWNVITDFASGPSWRSGLLAAEPLPDRDGRPVWRETSDFGELTYEVTRAEPPTLLVTTIVGEDLPFGGTWTYQLTAVDSTCRVTITEDGQIYNPLFRFMSRFIFGYHGTIEHYLQDLARKFGEEAVFVR